MSRITGLEIENFKRVRVLNWSPKAGMNVIRGKNEHGKTSTLDAVEALFNGARASPPEAIRKGETKAKVVGETEDLIATRKWWMTVDGTVKTELEVVAKADGAKIKGPQAIFDKMFPPESDPTAFFRMRGPERLEWLKRTVGIDTTPLDRAIDKVFDQRRLVKRDLETAETRLAGMTVKEPGPVADTAALLKEQANAVMLQQAATAAVQERSAALRRVDDASEAVKVAEMALQQARNRLEVARSQAAKADNLCEATEEAAEGTAATLEKVRAALGEAQASAAAHAQWKERQRMEAETARLKADTEAKEAELDLLRKQKHELISNAKFPIPGLGFGDGDVTFNDLPLEQASGAQRIRIGAAVLAARNPKMRYMRVPDGSLLDEDNLQALADFCDENGLQAFVEMVGEAGVATLILRDGEGFEPEGA